MTWTLTINIFELSLILEVQIIQTKFLQYHRNTQYILTIEPFENLPLLKVFLNFFSGPTSKIQVYNTLFVNARIFLELIHTNENKDIIK